MYERTGFHGNHKRSLMKAFLTGSLIINVLLIIVAGDSTMSMLRLKQVVSTKSSEISSLKNENQAIGANAKELLLRAQAAEGSLTVAREELLKIAEPDGKARPLPSAAFKYVAQVRPVSTSAVHVRSFSEQEDIAKQYSELAPAFKACDKRGKFGLDLCIIDSNANTDFMEVLVVWEDTSMSVGEIQNLTRCLRKQPRIKSKGDMTLVDWVHTDHYLGSCLPKPQTTL